MHSDIPKILSDPNIYTTCIVAVLIDSYGTEWLNWQPETIEMELTSQGIDVTPSLKDKLMVANTLLTTDTIHRDVLAFNNAVQVLNFGKISAEHFIPASLEDIMWGCLEMYIMEGKEDFFTGYNGKDAFSGDISYYVGKFLLDHGITKVPSMLKFAKIDQRDLDRRDKNIAEDPGLFDAYWDRQESDLKELEDDMKERSDELMQQLKMLPIESELLEQLKEEV